MNARADAVDLGDAEPMAARRIQRNTARSSTGETMLCTGVRQVRAISNWIDRLNRAQVHFDRRTRLTKMSSSELCVVLRS
jgi:hypothetical protein